MSTGFLKNAVAAVLAGLIMVALSVHAGAPIAGRQISKQADELRRITQRMADAVAIGDKAVWDRYTDATLVYVDENNIVKDKKTLLQELVPLPEGYSGSIVIADYSVRFFTGGAIATYILEESEVVEGHPLHNRYRETDTWLQKGGNWKIIASQVLAIPKDPPAIILPPQALDQYIGKYALSDKTQVDIQREGDHLVDLSANANTGAKPRVLLAEAADVFFTPGRPRDRRIFTRAGDGSVTGFCARREGEDLVWKRLPK